MGLANRLIMKNFDNFYKRVDSIANASKSKTKQTPSKGLLSKSKETPEDKPTSQDIYGKVAEYIKAIRKQKEEILNGKS
jgi:hypothetical protein